MAGNSAHHAPKLSGPAAILAIATATPLNVYVQSSYPDYYFNVTNSNHMSQWKAKFQRICGKSAIKTRPMALTEEFIRANPSLCQYNGKSLDARQKFVTAEVPKLGKEAAMKAIKAWNQPVSNITHLIFFTSTSVDMPGADVALANLMGLNPAVKRMMFYMQGCSGGGSLLRVAKDVAENNKAARILIVCGDMGSVATFRGPNEDDPASLVGQSFFGDGMAALIVGAEPDLRVENPLYEIHHTESYLLPGTEACVAGHVTETGMSFSISMDFPDVVTDCIHGMITKADAFKQLFGVDDVSSAVCNEAFWAVHTGGRRTLDELQAKMNLEPEKLQETREILAQNGNIGACTVMYVLERILTRSIQQGHSSTGMGAKWGFIVGYGPGIAVEVTALKACSTKSH